MKEGGGDTVLAFSDSTRKFKTGKIHSPGVLRFLTQLIFNMENQQGPTVQQNLFDTAIGLSGGRMG